MQTCSGITLEGLQCKNKTQIDSEFCGVHLEQKKEIETVFDPFYNQFIEIYGEKNCSPLRESISRFLPMSKRYVSEVCDVLPLPLIKNIIGPISYNEYTYKKRNIAIFGEYHTLTKLDMSFKLQDTVTFSGFLKSLATQRSDKQFDFFMEFPFISLKYNLPKSSIDESNIMLSILEQDFTDCLQLVKKCPYKNLRVHYTDVRNVINFHKSKIFTIYQEVLYYSTHKRLFLKFDDLMFKNPVDSYDDLQSQIIKLLQHEKILKQTTRNKFDIDFNKFVIMKFAMYKLEYLKFIETHNTKFTNTDVLIKRLAEPTELFLKFLLELLSHYMNLFSIFMDIYVLARILKSYPLESDDPKNIIIYTGNGHSKIFVDFFNYIDAINILNITGEHIIHFTKSNKEKSFLFG